MITTINEFKKINENNSLTVNIFNADELLKLLFDYDKHEYKDPAIFKRIRYFSDNDFSYLQKEKVKPFFVVLQLNNKVIGIAKVGYFDMSAKNKNDYSISFFSIDKDYRGNNYARLMCDELFKYAKEMNYEISTSSYTVLGKEYLQHLFNEYAKKYNVIFHDKKDSDHLHDTESYYKIVNGKKLHISEI